MSANLFELQNIIFVMTAICSVTQT